MNQNMRRIQRIGRAVFRRSFGTQPSSENQWNNVLKDAERAVGYPTSFLSLRWILNDEIANIANHIRKIIGTDHPILKTAKQLLLRNELPTWGLIVLLVSKTAGLNSTFSELECDKTADILHSQRIIAEVTEMIKTSHLMHKGLMNIDPSDEQASVLNFGNKLALLSGDYLLSSSFSEVSRLRNHKVQEIISSTLRDLVESEFIGMRDSQNKPVPTKPLLEQKEIVIPSEFGFAPYRMQDVLGNMKSEWILRNILAGGSLLGKCCQCALLLANHEKKVQELAYNFGRNLALSWQARLEKQLLINGDNFSLVSAPIMLHLEQHPEFYRVFEKGSVDYDYLRESVLKGPGMDRTDELQREFAQRALETLEEFRDNDSKIALVNIIKTM